MESSIRVRKMIFDELMEVGNNREHWEMLCCSEKPLVPFIGAGLSAWCYPTWGNLLMEIAAQAFSQKCAGIVKQALALQKNERKPHIRNVSKFHWMEEIAECMFGDDKETQELVEENYGLQVPGDIIMDEADNCYYKLHKYVGAESGNKKKDAKDFLNKAFDYEELKANKKMPDYQYLLQNLFPDVLITTNYDKALETCNPSIMAYPYYRLNEEQEKTVPAKSQETQSGQQETETHRIQESGNLKKAHSWLCDAIMAKVSNRQAQIDGREPCIPNVAVPDNPMLLKVHGSIEETEEVALTRSVYDKVYGGKMPEFLKKIYEKTTLVFLGCSLAEDRTLDSMEQFHKENAGNNGEEIYHFALLPYPSQGWKDEAARLKKYGVYPIFYRDTILKEYFAYEIDSGENYHDYFLGLLLEQLLQRKKYYSCSLEPLWDPARFERQDLGSYLEQERKKRLIEGEPRYIRRTQALQIGKMLSDTDECSMIAIIGEAGSGKSTLCDSVRKLHRRYLDSMQFFYISLSGCKSWEEFCISVYQGLNLLVMETPPLEEWKAFARSIARRCGAYWRCVLILDHMDELSDGDVTPALWETVKRILIYWKQHKIRIILTRREYPEGLPCYTWNMDKLDGDEAKRVFFSSCTLRATREITYMERKAVTELFYQQPFQPSSIYLLGSYANSKSDLTSLLEEWRLYHRQGEKGERTLARIMWNNLLDEHRYTENRQTDIKCNILWLWGILTRYPGVFPSVFFKCGLGETQGYKERKLTEKTLMYMKNSGLCEEYGNREQEALLKNMNRCVNDYFVRGRHLCPGGSCPVGPGHETQWAGMENFRGYTMPEYVGNLKSYVENECPECKNAGMNPEKDIMEILKVLSVKVKNSSLRNQEDSRTLNIVLHYEIKTVIRFLRSYLIQFLDNPARDKSSVEQDVLEVGCNFSHYFQYVPNHALPLVRRLISILDKEKAAILDNEKIPRPNREKVPPSDKERALWMCTLRQARLNYVMGDILRLSGKKELASAYYKTSIRLGNELLMNVFDRDNELYVEGLRNMAGALLISNYYGGSSKNKLDEMKRAQSMYSRIQDNSGIAYCNQRIGEFIFNEKDKDHKNPEDLLAILSHYNEAAKLFWNEKEITSYAYVLKCMGDVAVNYRDYLKGTQNVLKDAGSPKQLKLKNQAHSQWEQTDLFQLAASCYLDSFFCYCKYINWCGLSNVIQAMCTCYRILDTLDSGKHTEIVEALYGLAEECYRWQGDIRGLSDTLDYYGYSYKIYADTLRREGTRSHIDGKKGKPEYSPRTYECMALGKWRESREIWIMQGNETKADEIKRQMQELLSAMEPDSKFKPLIKDNRPEDDQNETG